MRFGLIGAGAIGAVRAAALTELRGGALAGVHDLDEARARGLARGTRYFPTAGAMIESGDIDAVVLSTPPSTHHDLALAAFAAGKHVLVEKPMAPSVDECRSMIAAAAKAGRFLAVGYNHRYFKALKRVRDVVESGSLGRLTHVRGYAGHTGLSEFKSAWMYDRAAMGGGALMDNGTHVVDLVRYIGGDFTQVYGHHANHVWKLDGVEDNATALLRSDLGVLASVEASWSEWKGYRFYVEAYGTHGMARAYYAPMMALVVTLDEPGGKAKVERNFYPGDIIREKLKGWQCTVIDAFREEFGDFIAAARAGAVSGGERIATGFDGLRAVETAHAVYLSGKQGCAVMLSQDLR